MVLAAEPSWTRRAEAAGSWRGADRIDWGRVRGQGENRVDRGSLGLAMLLYMSAGGTTSRQQAPAH